MSADAGRRADIVEVGRRLYARGYTASNDGNISVRLDDARLLMTPKNVCKGFMSADMMVVTDLDGMLAQLCGPCAFGLGCGQGFRAARLQTNFAVLTSHVSAQLGSRAMPTWPWKSQI